ncbi:Nicotinate-nucleotide adenylyltransferase [Methylovirgula sp. HY1]|nr:Nicotinate-nucleotide adenylyltransferase [Methylovirgula sp. HY1]
MTLAAAFKLPHFEAGLKIGLFGGSFNPPHEGHRAASLLALRRLGLDWVWWLVSPGNPLKDTHLLPPLATRIAAARALAQHPRIVVSGIEATIGTRYTYETIAYLTQRCPGVHFVWIMGADNLAGFHRWKRWRDIATLVPIAVVDRPGSTWSAIHSPAGALLSRYRFEESSGRAFALARPPAFIFLHGPRSPLSSTALRAKGDLSAVALRKGS